MTEQSTVYVPLDKIGIRRRAAASIAVIGNPNSGKSTLFNRLTGLRQTTGNYPGVTVEKHSGTLQLGSSAIELVDLPGIYCLGGYSADERIAVDVILGRIADTPAPDGLLVVLDATHLYQGLYLLQQLMEMQVPIVVALTMTDVATASGIDISIEVLQRHLGGIHIHPVVATTGRGLDGLKDSLASVVEAHKPAIPESWPELSQTADRLTLQADDSMQRIDVIQALLHPNSSQAKTLPAGRHEKYIGFIQQRWYVADKAKKFDLLCNPQLDTELLQAWLIWPCPCYPVFDVAGSKCCKRPQRQLIILRIIQPAYGEDYRRFFVTNKLFEAVSG